MTIFLLIIIFLQTLVVGILLATVQNWKTSAKLALEQIESMNAQWEQGMDEQAESYEQQFLSFQERIQEAEELARLKAADAEQFCEELMVAQALVDYHNQNCLLGLGEYPASNGQEKHPL